MTKEELLAALNSGSLASMYRVFDQTPQDTLREMQIANTDLHNARARRRFTNLCAESPSLAGASFYTLVTFLRDDSFWTRYSATYAVGLLAMLGEVKAVRLLLPVAKHDQHFAIQELAIFLLARAIPAGRSELERLQAAAETKAF